VPFADCGQLVPQLTLHDVLVQRGEAGATYALGRTERVRGRRATSDVLTGRRGRRIIKAAKEHLDDKTRSAAEEARAFVYSAWCHASFPHKPPASVEETWTVQTDYVSLRVDPGKRTTDTGEYSIGLPYGAYARLLCIDWSSQAYNNRSRDIELGKNLGDTMKRLGLNTGGGKTRERLLEQAERLVRCRLTFDIRGKGKSALINQTIVDTALDLIPVESTTQPSFATDSNPPVKSTPRFEASSYAEPSLPARSCPLQPFGGQS
jgi:Plasmid encoded RepA protein